MSESATLRLEILRDLIFNFFVIGCLYWFQNFLDKCKVVEKNGIVYKKNLVLASLLNKILIKTIVENRLTQISSKCS